jgi:hypothetical protein
MESLHVSVWVQNTLNSYQSLTNAWRHFIISFMRWRIFLFLLLLGVIPGGLICADVENISNSPNASEDVSVAINSAGEIGAVWIEKFSEGNQHVYFSIRRNGQWSSPAGIPGQSGNNATPRIAKGINGGFVAAWFDQTFLCVRFSQYQGSWSTPLTVSQVGGYDMGSPSITTTTNSRIAVAWTRGNPTFPDAYVNIFRSNTWSGPVNISNSPFGSKYCDLTAGPNGEIYSVWQDNLYVASTGQDDFYTMMSNDRGNGNWTQPAIIDNLNAWTFRPVVAVNSRNDILSCFYYMQGSSYWSVSCLNGEWQSPQVISDFGDHHDHNLYFSAACPYGNDGFLYIYRNCGRNIVYTVIRNGIVGNAVALTSSFQCYHPYIDYSSSIGAVAAWTDWSINSDVFVAIFDPNDTTPPAPPPIPDATPQPPLGVEANYRNIQLTALDLKTELIINRNLFTVQYYRKITWAFDANWSNWNITLSKYRIYRKLKTADPWEILAEVSPSVLLYIDKNGVSEEDRFDYQVRGVDTLGNEFYAYNWIRWAPNPANAERNITVQGYNVYRKLTEQSADSYTLWQAMDAATNSLEDHSTEIRQQTQYDYALIAVSDKGKESVKAEAQKFAGSKRKPRKL